MSDPKKKASVFIGSSKRVFKNWILRENGPVVADFVRAVTIEATKCIFLVCISKSVCWFNGVIGMLCLPSSRGCYVQESFPVERIYEARLPSEGLHKCCDCSGHPIQKLI